MASRRYRMLSSVVAVGVTAVLGVTLLPATSQADPGLTIAQVEQQLNTLEVDAEQAQERLNGARVASAAAQRKLSQINARVAQSQAAVDALQGTVGQLAAAAYRSGGVDQTLQLVLADDPGEFLAQASALDGVTRRQSDVLRRVSVAQQRLTQDKLVAAQQLGEIERLRVEAAKADAAAGAKVAAAKRLLGSLKAEQRRELEARQRAAAAQARIAAAAARAQLVTRSTRSSSGGSSSRPRQSVPSAPSDGSIGARAVAYALAQVGDRYVRGGTGPSSFDCSGLTMMAYRSAGVSLPHFSGAQRNSGRHVSVSELRPGDLVFYYSPISHVGMYIGGGRIVHAANPRTGVNVTSLYSMPYVGATRPY